MLWEVDSSNEVKPYVSFLLFNRAYFWLRAGKTVVIPFDVGMSTDQQNLRRLAVAHLWYAHYVHTGVPSNFYTIYEKVSHDSPLPMSGGKLVVSGDQRSWFGWRGRSCMWLLLGTCWRRGVGRGKGSSTWQDRLYAALASLSLAGKVHGVVYSALGVSLRTQWDAGFKQIAFRLDKSGANFEVEYPGRVQAVSLFKSIPEYETVRVLVD